MTTKEKILDAISTDDAKSRDGSDVTVFGNPDVFQLVCKASSKKEGWMKSTKVLNIGQGIGCVIQVSTQQGENVAEALCYVPGVTYHNGNFVSHLS